MPGGGRLFERHLEIPDVSEAAGMRRPDHIPHAERRPETRASKILACYVRKYDIEIAKNT